MAGSFIHRKPVLDGFSDRAEGFDFTEGNEANEAAPRLFRPSFPSFPFVQKSDNECGLRKTIERFKYNCSRERQRVDEPPLAGARGYGRYSGYDIY
ncbi:MAG: hypothetical protein WC661_00245 [Opitutaceae bacterium]